ncbi:MAG: histidinol-phosphate transaminase [Kiritimatiellae bacterium]|nr:histidinol-phosphate transaminase [Kiritimatiellia bacterium]
MRIADSVQKLEPYVPGEQPKSRDVVKLNTNENPYPPSPEVAKVLASFDLDRLRRYPDPNFAEIRRRLAEIWHTVPERVFVGNGSDEVLTLAARAFVDDHEAIGSFDPSYSLYRTLAAIRDVPFVESPLAADFSWTEPVVRGGDGTPVALFLLTNPNAPTSVAYPKDKIAAFARSFPGVTMVDEAYADFADENCVDLATAPDNRNVVVMRTLSKSFSLAGLRLGYCIGPEDLVEALYKVKDSYNVDAIAQEVALAALYDLRWMKANVAKVTATRERVKRELEKRGWQMPASQSNFLFAKPPAKTGETAHETAARIFDSLRGRHVYVRYFKGPKTGDRVRITVGDNADMDRLLQALDEIA